MSVQEINSITYHYTDSEKRQWSLLCDSGDWVLHMPNGEELWLSERHAALADAQPALWLEIAVAGILYGVHYGL
jgi:hypothetical protein